MAKSTARSSLRRAAAYGAVVIVVLIAVVGFGGRPLLGLDLKGGISVTLQPVEDGEVISDVDETTLTQTKEIIERRINGLGLVEPDVSVQGSVIVVQIPGVDDQERALELVGKTAELRFRPVLSATEVLSKSDQKKAKKDVEKLRDELKIPDDVTATQIYTDELTKQGIDPATGQPVADGETGSTTTTSIAPGGLAPTVPTSAPAASDSTATDGAASDEAGSSSGSGGNRSARIARQDDGSSTTTSAATDGSTTTSAPVDGSTTTTTTTPPEPKNQWGIDVTSEKFTELLQAESALEQAKAGATKPEDDIPEEQVTLDGDVETRGDDGKSEVVRYRYTLGPTLLTGAAIETATSGLSDAGAWEVRPVFKEGEDGIDLFNTAASQCNTGAQTCPTKQLAVVLDSEVLTAPTINEPTFSRDQITISGAFTEERASDVALALKYGALPITFEPQQVQSVSATIGKGALNAALIAGAIGIALVLVYFIAYYRLLGIVTAIGFILSGSVLWIVITLSSEWLGGTLSLAGIVGIIVSIGVSLDSNVVYFETFKEDVLAGRSARTAADSSFTSAFSTIVKANMSSVIGAAVLWLLSIGPIKGFAFYLGISVCIDMMTSYFFMHPAVTWLATRPTGGSARRLGVPVSKEPAV